MIISLENVIPTTLKDKLNPQTEIWGHHISFETAHFNLISAVSGSGKSTFMNILYGLRKDYEGQVMYDKKNIKPFNNNDFSPTRTNDISIVFQDLRLFNNLTAKENILINSNNKNELTDNQLELSKSIDIYKRLDKKASILSYGERQRVAILRALSQDYKFLFLDEPFSHLDKKNAINAYEIITADAQSKKAGIVMTTLGNEDFLTPDRILAL